MIAHLDDFCLWAYVLVDDMFQVVKADLRTAGAKTGV